MTIEKKISEPKYANTFKISYNKTEFIIDFGMAVPEKDTVRLVSRVAIPVGNIFRLLVYLFQSGNQYEKEFNTNIGFGNEENEITEKE